MNRSQAEQVLDTYHSRCEVPTIDMFCVRDVLTTCNKLRHKISVLNRRLLKVKAENRRLRKLLDGLKSIEIED